MPINTDPLLAAATSKTISGDNPQFTVQTIVFPATAIVATDFTRFECGFKPRKVRIANLTDRTFLEWNSTFPVNTWLKSAAGNVTYLADTLDTTANALLIGDRFVDVLQNATLGLILASKTVTFEAWG